MPEDKREESLSENCVHSWVIQEANGPTSWGTCQRCGETKEFKNSIYTKDGYAAANKMMHARNKADKEDAPIGYRNPDY